VVRDNVEVFHPQHVGELLHNRLRQAAAATQQMTDADPLLVVAQILGDYGLDQVELLDGDRELVDERLYAAPVPDRFVAGRTSMAQLQDLTVAVPFTGDPGVVRALLGTCTHSTRWTVVGHELRATFTVNPLAETLDQAKARIEAAVADAARHIAHGQTDLAKYRADLTDVVTTVAAQVRAARSAGDALRAGLGMPVRPAPTTPAQPPVAPTPAPTATTGSQLDILFERVMAETRKIGDSLAGFTGLTTGLTEERTRDVVIIGLRAAIPECEFTPETLHGQGKNDIHVRHAGQVVCVIELKRWSSEKKFKDCIDQLLSYLPHPDTRAAIVLLIGNKEVTPVVEKTRQWLLDHPNCDNQDLPGEHRRSDFRYHATGDPAQPIRMVYLPFALTTSATGASTNRGLAGAATAP
jgi:hypothetical protein